MTEIASGRSMPYYARLDGLRAIAVMAVFAEHFTYSELIRGWNPGMIGVRTFFVLSGFLITTILLNQRGTASGLDLAKRFFTRRFVRLSPPFYIAIALAALLGISGMPSDWWIHALYLSNIHVALTEQWSGAGHFWTLAVEEQFYLLWFPAVVLAPRRWLLPIIIGGLIMAPAFRMLIVFGASGFIDVLLPSQLDSLGIGGLMAVAFRTPALRWLDRIFLNRRLLYICLGLVFVLSAPWYRPGLLSHAILGWIALPAAVSLGAALLIRQCVAAEGQTLNWLQHPVLVHIGKISYGLYVFHYFVPPALYEHVPAIMVLTEGPLKIVRTLVWIIISFILAEISWRLIEQPLMRRRRQPTMTGEPLLTPLPMRRDAEGS